MCYCNPGENIEDISTYLFLNQIIQSVYQFLTHSNYIRQNPVGGGGEIGEKIGNGFWAVTSK